MNESGLKMRDGAYYGILGDAAKELCKSSDIPMPSLYMQLLALGGTLIGRRPFVNLLGSEHRANLFVVIVGKSGDSRKGTSWNVAHDIAKNADENIQKRTHRGIASGEGLIRLLGEAADDFGNVAFEGELSRLVTVKSYAGSTLSERIRAAFDCEPMSHDIKQSSMRVDKYLLSIVGHITPEELVIKFNPIEFANGFANRFLWCLAERTKSISASRSSVPKEKTKRIGLEISKKLESARLVDEVVLDDCAVNEFDDLCEELRTATSPLLRRGAAYLVRIALILALFDDQKEITGRHLIAAKAVWDYSAASVLHLLGSQIVTFTDPVSFLRDYLADGPMAAKSIEEDARHEGISVTQLRAAREQLGISFKSKAIYRDSGVSHWKLPKALSRVPA